MLYRVIQTKLLQEPLFAHCGGGVGRLMANAILNFHFDFPHTSLTLNIVGSVVSAYLILRCTFSYYVDEAGGVGCTGADVCSEQVGASCLQMVCPAWTRLPANSMPCWTKLPAKATSSCCHQPAPTLAVIALCAVWTHHPWQSGW